MTMTMWRVSVTQCDIVAMYMFKFNSLTVQYQYQNQSVCQMSALNVKLREFYFSFDEGGIVAPPSPPSMFLRLFAASGPPKLHRLQKHVINLNPVSNIIFSTFGAGTWDPTASQMCHCDAPKKLGLLL